MTTISAGGMMKRIEKVLLIEAAVLMAGMIVACAKVIYDLYSK